MDALVAFGEMSCIHAAGTTSASKWKSSHVVLQPSLAPCQTESFRVTATDVKSIPGSQFCYAQGKGVLL